MYISQIRSFQGQNYKLSLVKAEFPSPSAQVPYSTANGFQG